ncbi:MAG: ribosome maturation factor RimP [Microthrixaceae bacterium]
MSATTERVGDLVAPILERMDLELYDIDQPGGTLRVLVDGTSGVGVDQLAEVSRALSSALDADEPIAGSYTLEVSSPGLERPLRQPRHYEAAIGERVKLKLFPGGDGDRRIDGVLSAVGPDSVRVTGDDGVRIVEFARIAKAHTVFEWDGGAGTDPVRTRAATTESVAETESATTTESTHESEEDNR